MVRPCARLFPAPPAPLLVRCTCRPACAVPPIVTQSIASDRGRSGEDWIARRRSPGDARARLRLPHRARGRRGLRADGCRRHRRGGPRRAVRARRPPRRAGRNAARASLTGRATSTRSSTRRRSRSAGPGEQRPRQDRAVREDLGRASTSTTSTFPGNALDPGCDYERWSRRVTAETRADGLRPCRDRPRPSRTALAPVLVLLRLQRLEQPPRGRLGDDPARLPGATPRRRSGRSRSRSATASTRAPSGRSGGREARARRRDAPGRLPGCRLARELLRGRAVPRALRRRASAATTRGADARRFVPTCGRSPVTLPRRRRHTRGSPSRAAGASARRRSTTARPART